jgi:hypothetical protein
MADKDRTFDPSEVEVNRSREQGLGFGQRELQRQHDPEQNPEPSLTDDDEDGEPGDEEAVHSANHATRGEKTDEERGQGAKTRQASKDTISRRM